MKQVYSFLIVLIFPYFIQNSLAQSDDLLVATSQNFLRLYEAGDFINAEKCISDIINSQHKIPERYKIFIYNSMGLTNTQLGKYNDALNYYNMAEKSVATKEDTTMYLGGIYINKAIILGYQKSYNEAIDFFEKGIRIMILNNPVSFGQLSAAYLNLGIFLYETQNYVLALEYLKKSLALKLKFHLSGLALVYLNMAKTYESTNDFSRAEDNFIKSIENFITEYDQDYYRLAEVYIEYGPFLYASGRHNESLETLNKGLSICLQNYGEKHLFTSFSYKLIGDFYKNQSDYNTALKYYQKSLISIVDGFNDSNVFTNPSIDSSLFDIRLLDDLKCKAQALELLSGKQDSAGIKLKTLNESFKTSELALKVIARIRNNYLTEESRLYLADHEKETYLFAVHTAFTLYKITGENGLVPEMYSIAQKAKAAVLRDEITENELLRSAAIPDSLRQKQNTLAADIAAYNKLILEESNQANPDSSRISLWKDALFEMNREKERVAGEIDMKFPLYHELLLKTEPVEPGKIQKKLKRNETIIDYLLSNQNSGSKRMLFVFVITRNNIEIRETSLDSTFLVNAEIVRKNDNPEAFFADRKKVFIEYTGALSFMYEKLLKPVEKLLSGTRIIIIPDEEIAWLPFDAFLKEMPQPGQKDYEGLKYLINDYTFSYAYSSSLIFGSRQKLKKGEELLSFSPDYSKSSPGGTDMEKLAGAKDEIESIFKWFRGRKFTGGQATESNFRLALGNPAIFHLAMHSISDSLNSKYSYLLFDMKNDTAEDGRLFNYEICLIRISSPMVVLSACNSGTGTLYHGEGLMSLARGFMLAGASSVIKTSWEVNDDVSANIISGFYRYLAKGCTKDMAMRKAKTGYMANATPEYSNPYYWAAYEVLGDNDRIKGRNYIPVVLIVAAVILAVITALLYLRRRRISRARPL